MKRLLAAFYIALIGLSGTAALAINTRESSFLDWQKLTLGDGRTHDYYGSSVAMSTKFAVVGAPGRDSLFPFWEAIGAAFVYEKVGTEWVHRQYLLGSNLDGGDSFGNVVDIDGEIIVVGAQNDDHVGRPQGSAFVIVRGGGDSWYEEARLLRTPEPGQGDWFGGSVAISGNTVVVGSQMENNGIGSAYVFTRNGSIWTQQARLVPSDGQTDDRFGRHVEIDGDTIVVTSIFDDETFDRQGSVYVFTRNGSTWTQNAKLVSDTPNLCGEFGESLSVSGNTVVVGCPYNTVNGVINRGTAYVFERSGTTWPLKQKLLALDGTQWDRFGSGVSIDGSNMLVGALAAGVADNGSAYLFRRRSGTWVQESQFFPLDPAGTPFFGESVAIFGGNLIVGALGDDVSARQDQGSASAFVLPGTSVLIGGRVLGPDGRGLRSTVVTMTDSRGTTVYAMTNPFGYYRFADVGTGSEYTFAVPSKSYIYQPRILTVHGELANLDFTPAP